MKIEMTADEFRQWQQGNDTLNNKVIDLSVRLNTTAEALKKEQNDHYNTRNNLQNVTYDRDQNKAIGDSLRKQIDDPATGWRKQLSDANAKIQALDGKSAVPIAALKNFVAAAIGNPDDKKNIIDALKALTLQRLPKLVELDAELTDLAG